jgi:diguanylate cyclase (GGDEF)-like protein/putative nucleotidyltransferase with HDIG domain
MTRLPGVQNPPAPPITAGIVSPPADPTGLDFRLRNVHAGVALSVFCCTYLVGYCAVTWSQPHRGVLLALAIYSIVSSVLILRLPLERVMRHPRRRDAFFMGWSTLLIVFVTVFVLFDGGVSSPITAVYFLPLVFAALSYPVRSMVAVSVIDVVAYIVAALAVGGVSTTEMAVVALTLVCASWMCASQARMQDLQRDELSRVSRADPLTGALNRRGFDERFAAELDRAARAGTALGLILVDLDDFKGTNDRLGHAAGDAQLRWVVDTMTATLRPSDAVGRLGGDEFAVLVPGAGPGETSALAARVQETMAEAAPASMGVASFPADGLRPDALHQVADLDLYAVKRSRTKRRAPAGPRAFSWATTLARAVDDRMATGHEHSLSVARYATLIGERLEFSDDELASLRLAAILHDIGKIAVPETVLRKPEPLTPAERTLVERHPTAGADMVASIDGLAHIAPWVRHSHEHFDGSGYPDRLAADEIPLESRILLVADAFDAMTSERAYSAARPVEEALAELRRCAGRQFDAECVALLCAALAGDRAELVDGVVRLV